MFPRVLYTVLWISTPFWSARQFFQLSLSQVGSTGAVGSTRAGQCCSVPVSVQECYLHQNITEVSRSPNGNAVFSPRNLFCSCSAALCHGFCRESTTQDPASTLKDFCICVACLAEMGERRKVEHDPILSERSSVVGPEAFLAVIMSE